MRCVGCAIVGVTVSVLVPASVSTSIHVTVSQFGPDTLIQWSMIQWSMPPHLHLLTFLEEGVDLSLVTFLTFILATP